MSAQLEQTTSPAARPKQKQVISEIPLDIFFEIFSHFEPANKYKSSVHDIKPEMTTLRNRTLHSMALVCRDFYHHLFPLLFENVYVSESGATSNDKKGGPSHCARFCRSIVEGNEQARRLATYTKRFAIDGLDVHNNNETQQQKPEKEQSLSTFSKAIAYMANLQELYLCYTTNDLLHSAICLQALNLLRLECCGVSEKLDASLLAKFSTLHVARVFAEQKLSYGDSFPYENFTRHLCMSQTERFASEVCVDGSVLRGLASSSSPMQCLQYLSLGEVYIDRVEPELISSVLSMMPALKFLHIAEVHYHGCDWDLDMEFSRQFRQWSSYPKLPQLAHIHAPLYAVEALVPDSHASSVGFTSEYLNGSIRLQIAHPSDDRFWHDCASFLNASKHYMLRLGIPAALYWRVHFATQFPELRRLTVRTEHCNWDAVFLWHSPETTIKSFLEIWDSHPRLDELSLISETNLSSGSAARISLPQDIMDLLKEKIPTLRVLKIVYVGSNSEQCVDMSGSVSD
ncbi:hypothetical protein D9619_010276 [Psilocybe cf. subviscida]|uniref:F-box domain-containing protein n=1 Tax=Psilocybe cf. subviscida TaxID=2480587 RepID=A0A8H5ASJ4_9AGAR|nr:hypothetical protein D9619_010276 [Psilocybe cf. subviscida]